MNATLAIYGIQDRNNLGYPRYVHDHSLCLMQSGKIVQYLQLERHTRKKYDHQMNHHLETLLNKKLVNIPKNCDWVFVNSFVGSSFISKNGKVRFDALPEKQLGVDFNEGYGWLELEKWQGKAIKAYSVSHELAHVFSCLPFFGNFRDNSLLISFDGGASLGNFAAFHYQNQELKVVACDWDLREITHLFNANGLSFALLGISPKHHNSLAGKLMGFAAYGRYRPEVIEWLGQNNYFFDYWTQKDHFHDSAQQHFGWQGQMGDLNDPFLQDIAFAFQYVFQQRFLKRLQALQEQLKADYLYYAGGCALSIPTNRQIVNNGWFKEVYIPPCCNDSGLSIGGAAFLEWKKQNKPILHSPYLNNVGASSPTSPPTNKVIAQLAKVIIQNKIIGICQGAAEVGPRALGNRSIVALPNSKALAKKVSEDCKKREWYRPVAPVMLARNTQLVTGIEKLSHLADYMLMDFEILPQYREALAGVVHINGTARIQVIRERTQNPLMFDLLTYLDEHHGILALINTSFNAQEEPIVHTPDQALASGQTMGLDGVFLNEKLVLFEQS
ncbi:hypothetical protein BKI52_01120 [marine bacterium AO1-C]|nr:hypothetical protein BKI52_01120 [marine bacterium AO1-C]